MNKNKRSGTVARAAMLITLASTIALLCAATPISNLTLQGNANANGNSLTNAATISATNGWFNNLAATNGITGPVATTNLVGLGAGVPAALGSSVSGTGSIVLTSNATLTTPQATTYPTTYFYSTLIEGDESGPKTFCSVDTVNFNSITKGGADLYTALVNCRDCRLLKVGTTYYLSYTAGLAGTSYIGLAYSTDLVNWITLTTPNWSSYITGSETSIWNGCWYFDGSNYWMYFAAAGGSPVVTTPYIVQFTPNGASSSFGTPISITFSPTRAYADVMSVNKISGTYYGLVQSFGSTTGTNQYVETWSSSALSGTNYVLTTTNNADGFGSAVEGGAQVQLPNGSWKTYVATYGGGYLYSSTNTSLTTNAWSAPVVVSNFNSSSTNVAIDWIDVVPFQDMQTEQCLANLTAGGGSSIISAAGTTTVSNNLSVKGTFNAASPGSTSGNIGGILQANLSSGNYQTFNYGVANSNGNCESLGYSYNGNGNANNQFWLGQFGEPVTFIQWKGGDISIGNPDAATDPGVPLWINGNVTTTGNFNLTGAIDSSSTQTTSNGSTAGTVVSSMPFQGPSYKKAILFFSGFNGTTTYVFPTAFTSTNDLIVSGSLASDATVTTTQVGITTTTNSTGSITIEGY